MLEKKGGGVKVKEIPSSKIFDVGINQPTTKWRITNKLIVDTYLALSTSDRYFIKEQNNTEERYR